VQNDEMDKALGRREIVTGFSGEKPIERYNLEDLGIDRE
jgi:hypothetical protein